MGPLRGHIPANQIQEVKKPGKRVLKNADLGLPGSKTYGHNCQPELNSLFIGALRSDGIMNVNKQGAVFLVLVIFYMMN